MKFIRGLNLSSKVLLGVVPLIVASGFLTVYLNNQFEEEQMMEQALASAQTYADIIRESLVNMMVDRLQVDETFLDRIEKLNEIDSLRLVLNDLRLRPLLMTPDRALRIKQKMDEYRVNDAMESEVILSGSPLWERSGDVFRAIIPFKADARCQRCHQVDQGYVLAAANIHISLSRFSQAIMSNAERTFWIFIGFSVLAVSIAVFIFRRFVGLPVNQLMKATDEIAEGNLSYSVTGNLRGDEIARLGGAFESMRIALKKNLEELEEVNATLVVRKRQLEDSLEALRRAQEELIQSERMATVGQMASSIIHDFKNPMSVIYTYIQMLKQEEPRDDNLSQRAHDGISKSVQLMLDMTQELLDFSRGEMHLQRSESRADDFIADVVESVTMNLRKNKVDMVVDQQFHGVFLVDVDRLRRALINIINNAQEAMPNGGILTLRTQPEDGHVRIEISDNGVGIPDELKERIFEPFVTHGKSKGTGLGLAVTKRVIDEHRGSISVKSERNKGTTFTIHLPLFSSEQHTEHNRLGAVSTEEK